MATEPLQSRRQIRPSADHAVPQPMQLLDNIRQELQIHPAGFAEPPSQLNEQLPTVLPSAVAQPPGRLLLAHGDVDQLGDHAPHLASDDVPLHVQQRLDVVVARDLGLPHPVMRAG